MMLVCWQQVLASASYVSWTMLVVLQKIEAEEARVTHVVKQHTRHRAGKPNPFRVSASPLIHAWQSTSRLALAADLTRKAKLGAHPNSGPMGLHRG